MAEEALNAYAAQVLAGTGLTPTDVTGADEPAEGSAAHALRHGWDVARRAAKITPGGPAK
ncbi:MAG: hypothetical protein O3B27_03615 [Actinomycetota bacterium]|nr:hypothetical protein [Actinomycetota bacterium]MDA2948920.1 hypothetical protein [Actinomycetota bacterium]MDA2990636.1 hypothetical protein [Actinomycetota bacterium]